jgi:hypothetical protein
LRRGKPYTQIARQIRLQPLGMGAFTVSQPGLAPCSQQSNEPVPGAGDTHDGVGGDSTQAGKVGSETHPSGQMPESGNAKPRHP